MLTSVVNIKVKSNGGKNDKTEERSEIHGKDRPSLLVGEKLRV